jgi:RNA polymerase sigma-70 factor, ECF subfamily
LQLTVLLQRLGAGEPEAIDNLMPLVYQELKKLARSNLRREVGPPLETTELVHEAFLKLAKGRHPSYENRSHFYGIVSKVMRQVLVDEARARATEKRGPGQNVPLSEAHHWRRPNLSLLALNDGLMHLEKTDPHKGQLLEMHYFGGMTAEETAQALAISVHAVRRQLRLAQAWLRRQMAEQKQYV